MDSFLHDVASSLYNQYGDQLEQIDVVFASRRAIRYFHRELEAIGAPKMSCYSMDSWITQLSENASVGSRFTLISTLYSIYSKYHDDQSFEHFYSFGNLLVSDFDMIDRYLVDARSLYSIVADTREIETSGDDPLRDAAIEFWSKFDSSSAERLKQQEFFRVWRSLYDIYIEFNNTLEAGQTSYSGRIYRQVAENLDAENYGRKTIFVGLNALSESEKQILLNLNKYDLADFIWDYDPRWTIDENSECSYFISRNIKQLPQADYFQTSIYSPEKVKIEVIEAPSDAAQTKLLPRLLDQILVDAGRLDERTAIILTDENLLVPLLYSLPKSVGQLNISMGYPLRATLAYRFMELLTKLQRRTRKESFYLPDVAALMAHPYISGFEWITPDKQYLGAADLPQELNFLWKFASSSHHSLYDYLIKALTAVTERLDDRKEVAFLAQIIEQMGVVHSMILQSGREISISLYLSLLSDAISAQSIEFEGVSGQGLQIIGILESRTLDFDRVIILSMTDDNFPSSRPDSSYIPQLLLQGHGMPTMAEKSAIWSYYFYRLLQRASDVKLLYCNVADGMTTGEQSRYISQLEYSSPYDVSRRVVSPSADDKFTASNVVSIDKSDTDIEVLSSLTFYPSMFSSYLNCPLSFYFASIERIERPSIDEQRITAIDTGNILHRVMQTLYREWLGKAQVTNYIAAISDKKIDGVIDSVMAAELGQKLDNEPAMASIARQSIRRMVDGIVRADALDTALFQIEMLEERISGQIAGVEFAGVIDRVDRLVDGSIRVIDYKTGAVDLKVDSIELLFDELESKGRNSIAAQMLIYSLLARKKWNVDITPAVYAARKMGSPMSDYLPLLVIEKEVVAKLSDTHYQMVEQSIKQCVNRLYDQYQPFSQTQDLKTCKYCPYAQICRR